MKYKFIEHTADIKFQAFGENKEEVFENSALALKNVISEDKVDSKEKETIKIKTEDLENLLVDFLEEFLVLFENKGFILSNIEKIKIKKIDIKKGCEKYELNAIVLGDFLEDSEKKDYEISNHIKAITYNEIFIKKTLRKGKEEWVSQIVVDV